MEELKSTEDERNIAKQMIQEYMNLIAEKLVKEFIYNKKIRNWPLIAKYNLAKHMEIV